MIALLCALLLLTASCVSAEDATIAEFRDMIQLNGRLPDGYSYSPGETTDLTMTGTVRSADSSAPSLVIFFGFNESYSGVESLDRLDKTSLEIIRQGFSGEDDVTFSMFDTASGDQMLCVRENNGRFLDFYTICLGYEIELTLTPANGKTLTDAQIKSWTEYIRTVDILPILG